MRYDFQTVTDRSASGSVKWNMMLRAAPETPPGIIPLSIGDMELKTPPEIVAGLQKYLSETILGYTAPTDAYYEAVTGWFRSRHGWETDREWLVGFDGVVPSLYTAVAAFTEPGDNVMYMPPVYRPLYFAIEDNQRRPAEVPLLLDDGGYSMDFGLLEETAADPRTSLLLFCSPHNPVSRVWRREELECLAGICRKHNVLVVSDEIHMDFIMPGHRHIPWAEISPECAENSIICTAPSKTFNIAGLQASNIVIPNPELRKRFRDAYQATGRYDINQLGLEACRLAYACCGSWLDEALELIRRNGETARRFMHEHFPEIRVFSHEGTYFLWLDFRSWGIPPKALEKHMTGKAALFLDEGYIFGRQGDGFERINLACPATVLEQALERLRKAGRP